MATETKFEIWSVVFVDLLIEDFGLSVLDAAAIVGNAGHESAGFVTLQEVKPTVPGSRGGWGIMQWTGIRRRAAEAYWKRNNLNPSDMMANYKFLWVELNGSEGKVLPALRAAQGLEAKTKLFSQRFLRPGVPHYVSRIKWAKRALTIYEKRLAKKAEPQYNPPSVTAPIPVPNNPFGEIAMLDTKFWGIVRHVVGGIGAGLVGFGFATSEDVAGLLSQFDALAGAVMFIVGIGASMWAKIKA